MENQYEMEFDLLELFYRLKKKCKLFLIVTLACGLLGFAFSKFIMTPQYVASTRVYMHNRSYETTVVYSDFQTANYMLSDYRVLITGENVTKEVIKQLDLDISSSALASKISLTAEDNTRVLQINVTDADPQLAADIANCVREVATEQIQEIMELEAVKLVYEADVPENPSSPNATRNALLAAMLGLLVCVVVEVVVMVLDDSIRTEEDVERYLGLSTLGSIPATSELDTMSGRSQTGGRNTSIRRAKK